MRTKQMVGIIGLAAFALLALFAVHNLQSALRSLQLLASAGDWLSGVVYGLFAPIMGGLILAAAPMAIPVDDLNEVVGDIKDKLLDLENLSTRFKGLQDDNAQLK